jgi:SAM-dependent methyltransferase
MVSVGVLFCEVWRGKSIGRILTNEALSQWASEMHGVVLDVACGSNPSYRGVLNLMGGASVQLIGVDCLLSCRPTVVADLTRPLPFKTGVADAAVMSSFLYIPPDPERVLREVSRVLRSHGLLVLTAPLVYPYTPEPTDHWRFTEEGLRCLLSRSGFAIERLIPIGGRWTSSAYLLSPILRPRWLTAPLVYWLSVWLDGWTSAWLNRLPPCPIGYVVKARKGDESG